MTTATLTKGQTVFYSTGSAIVRATVKTLHRDGSITVTALFYQRDGKDVPGYLGFPIRMDAATVTTDQKAAA